MVRDDGYPTGSTKAFRVIFSLDWQHEVFVLGKIGQVFVPFVELLFAGQVHYIPYQSHLVILFDLFDERKHGMVYLQFLAIGLLGSCWFGTHFVKLILIKIITFIYLSRNLFEISLKS